MIACGWRDITPQGTLRAVYAFGFIRLEYHAACQTWRARAGDAEWGPPDHCPARALRLCHCPVPALEDMAEASKAMTTGTLARR